MDQTYYLKQGDSGIYISCVLRDVSGILDLTDAAEVLFLMRPEGGGMLVINDAAEIGGAPANGVVKYKWMSANTTRVGRFEAEWQVTFAGGILTFPNHSRLIVEITESYD